MIYSNLRYHRVGTSIDFMLENRKEVQGMIWQMEATINEYQINIVYHVLYEDVNYEVDGELFTVIKKQ